MKTIKWVIFGISLILVPCAFAHKAQVYINGVVYTHFLIINKIKVPPPLSGKFNPLNLDKINNMFSHSQKLNLPFEYIKDCCFERGYRISQYFHSMGVRSLRVIALGKMKTLIDKWGFKVNWQRHTATALVDIDRNIWLIDPSLSDRPLLLNDWLGLFIEPNEKIELMIGSEFVYDMSDLTSVIAINSYSRAHVEEVVKGSLLGCEFLQNRNNKNSSPLIR